MGQITFTTDGTPVMTTTNGYDLVNRLTNTVSLGGTGATLSQFDYRYNTASQRTSVTNLDGSYWVYGYDSMGQVTSGRKYWSDGTPVAGQQFDYAFDDIGNRQTTMRDLRQASYSVNSLNQYTSRDVPGFVNVLGTATNTATVSLWSQDNLALYTPTTRQGDYFRGEMLVNNNTGALWLTITNVAVLSNYTGADIVTNIAGSLLLAQNPETFIYDADGNLTNDGRWSYTWDAENRITSFTRNSAAPAGSKVKLDCQYDSKSRRTQKIVSSWNGSTYVAQSTNKFVYDGWNLIAILDSNSSLLASFQWGIDASGSLQGAGGVGGLLSMTIHSGANAGTYFYCYDGNHNVTTLVNATNGAIEAVYDYEPFLGILRATGRLAFINPFVGSTKFCDWETGLLYYGYRYYDPDTGRWLSRDPLGEEGGLSLYGFVGNQPVTQVDKLGRNIFKGCCNGISFNRLTQCCRCGKIYSKLAVVGTGVLDCYRPPGMLGHSYPHAWLRVPTSSYSVGFYPGSSNPFGGPGQLDSPDEAAQETIDAGMTTAWCKEIKLSPCSYDPERFKKLVKLWRSGPFSYYFYGFHDCRHFARYAIKKAAYESTYNGDCDFRGTYPESF
ncbi:MAG: tRNA(Glu)-specific nuclease WapA precursor [Verrucomicrobia bacterium ADurb.Bin118]|nr:MAG: tRNA(Glu)-specific nuclease WapA precursor [Verrucomicrobia bacterium ADurb.Bin118]